MKVKLGRLRALIREALLAEDVDSGTFYRVQPNGKDVFGHISGLAYEQVPGIFAFTDPQQLFDTYTWIHVKKKVSDYEMVTFQGTVVERPEDSEGVVVKPERVIDRMPLEDWLQSLN